VYGFDGAIDVFNFEQIGNRLSWQPKIGTCRGTVEGAMSKTDEFWQYAKEAILSASYAKTDDERQGLLDLARTWTQAALVERHFLADRDSPTLAA
jgi:hypothetical protein